KRIGRPEFDEAIERVIAGPQRKSRILGPKERELTAYHEGGHALLGKLLPHATPPHKVTILPRGMALGYVIPLPQEEKYTLTRGEILADITAMLGGRVAEELTFGEITTGAANDFEKATDLARKMVTEFGMSDKLGPLALGTKHGPVFLGRDLVESRNYSDEIAYEIDQEVRRIIDECYRRARQVLTEHKDLLDRIAQALLERESLESDELDALMTPPAPEPPKSPESRRSLPAPAGV
ncbi:MAG TPA: cell division protein FtsH, partial [bacterium]|nr:cell division protein FtsH [bacterium]